MKILDFQFKNNKQNWHIDKVEFDDLNLLVGASGVGKTRILIALDLICDVAKGKRRNLDSLDWSINFSHLGNKYKWELKSSSSPDDNITLNDSGTDDEILLNDSEHSGVMYKKSEITYEKLIRYDADSEAVIIHRSISNSELNGEKLPKLKRSESAIALLSEEDSIVPVGQAFKRFTFNEAPQQMMISVPFDPAKSLLSSENGEPEEVNLQKFQEGLVDAPAVVKALLLQKFFPNTFNEIKECYVDIFPSVKDVRVSADRESQNQYRLFFEIKEVDSNVWIPQHRMSSGMFRTLSCLVEVLAAPEESVILIDEFENSLGINCISELTDFILDKSPGLQFILTSHHPYIINNIPWKTWHIVTRFRNEIRVRKATDIPELDTASSLDKFTQLVNLLGCEELAE